VDASGEVSCECKTHCSHAADLAQLDAAAVPDEAVISLHVQRQQCAVLAAKIMVGSMTATAEQLATARVSLQELVSGMCALTPPVTREATLQSPEWPVIPILTRKEVKKTHRKRKHPIPSQSRILEEKSLLSKNVRLKGDGD
jgi:hypothetical protein